MTSPAAPVLTRPIDPRVAAERLRDWGFLAHADLPDDSGDAYLLVGLRATPTLRHFDPERVDLWVTEGSRGSRLEITRRTAPLEMDYSWGTVAIVDRLHASNEYMTFGGLLTVSRVAELTIVILVSPTPILRRGGHSQGWDQAAAAVAAFFGRLMVAVDYGPGFEVQLSAASPRARYAAFIADSIHRLRISPVLREERRALWALLCGERRRFEADDPGAWQEGVRLAASAGLGEDG